MATLLAADKRGYCRGGICVQPAEKNVVIDCSQGALSLLIHGRGSGVVIVTAPDLAVAADCV